MPTNDAATMTLRWTRSDSYGLMHATTTSLTFSLHELFADLQQFWNVHSMKHMLCIWSFAHEKTPEAPRVRVLSGELLCVCHLYILAVSTFSQQGKIWAKRYAQVTPPSEQGETVTLGDWCPKLRHRPCFAETLCQASISYLQFKQSERWTSLEASFLHMPVICTQHIMHTIIENVPHMSLFI